MKKAFIQVGQEQYPYISNTTLIGEWNEVKGLPLSEITKKDTDTATLDGLIIKGYEMKWGETNENFERYEKTAFDKFINEYFVEKGFNLVVDIQHKDDLSMLAGRVIYAEVNTTGFYLVAYIPRSYELYDTVKQRLQEGILQGFSKCGYATDWKFIYKPDGTFDYELIKEMKLLSVSLVANPANGVKFEKLQEVKNGLTFVNVTIKQEKDKSKLSNFLNFSPKN